MTSNRIVARVNALLDERSRELARHLLPTDSLRDDLKLDHFDLIELALDIQTEFSVDVPEDAERNWLTVADVHECVLRLKGIEENTPGTDAYRERVEAMGQRRLDGEGAP